MMVFEKFLQRPGISLTRIFNLSHDKTWLKYSLLYRKLENLIFTPLSYWIQIFTNLNFKQNKNESKRKKKDYNHAFFKRDIQRSLHYLHSCNYHYPFHRSPGSTRGTSRKTSLMALGALTMCWWRESLHRDEMSTRMGWRSVHWELW